MPRARECGPAGDDHSIRRAGPGCARAGGGTGKVVLGYTERIWLRPPGNYVYGSVLGDLVLADSNPIEIITNLTGQISSGFEIGFDVDIVFHEGTEEVEHSTMVVLIEWDDGGRLDSVRTGPWDIPRGARGMPSPAPIPSCGTPSTRRHETDIADSRAGRLRDSLRTVDLAQLPGLPFRIGGRVVDASLRRPAGRMPTA